MECRRCLLFYLVCVCVKTCAQVSALQASHMRINTYDWPPILCLQATGSHNMYKH